ncbi:MAG: MOSC domain-containing protein [Rhodospirillales bacterium]
MAVADNVASSVPSSAGGDGGLLVSVQVGRIAPLGPDLVPTAFVKRPVGGPITVAVLGLAGDEQADPTVHGGPEKAVYACALANYAAWRQDFPEHAPLWVPGGLGENLTLDGLDEEGVHIGDIVRVGGVRLQVTQPRQPCYKFALRFRDKRMPKAMVANGRSGWYYRVLATGSLAAGDRLELIDRPNPDWSIARFNRVVAAKATTIEDYAQIARLAGLSAGWRDTARHRLARAVQTGEPDR